LSLVLFAGCGRRQTATTAESKVSPETVYVKVFITKSGQVALDGKSATIDEVATAFNSLAKKRGLVLYARESPEEYEPHPNAMKVIELVTRNSLPIRLCMNKDCSDQFDANGRLRTQE
jgi:hypothetical protein